MKRVILHPQKSALFSGLCERKSLFFDMYNTGSEKHTNLALANQLPLKQGLRPLNYHTKLKLILAR